MMASRRADGRLGTGARVPDDARIWSLGLLLSLSTSTLIHLSMRTRSIAPPVDQVDRSQERRTRGGAAVGGSDAGTPIEWGSAVFSGICLALVRVGYASQLGVVQRARTRHRLGLPQVCEQEPVGSHCCEAGPKRLARRERAATSER